MSHRSSILPGRSCNFAPPRALARCPHPPCGQCRGSRATGPPLCPDASQMQRKFARAVHALYDRNALCTLYRRSAAAAAYTSGLRTDNKGASNTRLHVHGSRVTWCVTEPKGSECSHTQVYAQLYREMQPDRTCAGSISVCSALLPSKNRFGALRANNRRPERPPG